jgi:hypothetical protein
MNLLSPVCLLIFCVFLLIRCNQPAGLPLQAAAALPPKPQEVKGLTLVAPPDSFLANPMPAVQSVGANWIAVVPYAFTPPGKADLHYNVKQMQWWGERPEGVLTTIRLAKDAGLHVMLKPQVWIPHNWTGTLNFQTEAEWEQWEAEYLEYILEMARLADSTDVEIFCIGTEFRTAIAKRPGFWTELIQKVRSLYPGKLVYSANWDDWDRVPFWPSLDYIGLSGYFPLAQADTPSVKELCKAWEPIRERLRKFSEEQKKPVLFTEFGYLSVDQAGWRNWEIERGIESRSINEQAQANCFRALFTTFQGESWWAGGFLWKWFPNMRGHEGYPERDYTPQGKLGELELRKWYKGG